MSATGYSLESIVRAVIQRESSGRQTDASGGTLTSKAGALGLMQLEPATAAQLGVDPNDAQQNVAGGTKYLLQLFQKYGDWFNALAAYNWGPGNVDRALANGTPFPAGVSNYASGVMEDAS
jgi:soluble lytic murein transglycosylase-like protein